uniref:RBR-type E3 ubiquitin transferase n=1 Tax=Amphiprion ocellaris TaxID=80972 RepID=A0AAQ6AHV1_AMPOC
MERKDLSNLCVICIICTADQGGTYQFCWQCQKPWKGSAPRSDRCGNDDCINRDLQLLQTCKSIDLPEVAGVTSCPSIRLCPTCGMKIEHSRQNCKNVICRRCHKEFCFVCLKLTAMLQDQFTIQNLPRRCSSKTDFYSGMAEKMKAIRCLILIQQEIFNRSV